MSQRENGTSGLLLNSDLILVGLCLDASALSFWIRAASGTTSSYLHPLLFWSRTPTVVGCSWVASFPGQNDQINWSVRIKSRCNVGVSGIWAQPLPYVGVDTLLRCPGVDSTTLWGTLTLVWGSGVQSGSAGWAKAFLRSHTIQTRCGKHRAHVWIWSRRCRLLAVSKEVRLCSYGLCLRMDQKRSRPIIFHQVIKNQHHAWVGTCNRKKTRINKSFFIITAVLLFSDAKSQSIIIILKWRHIPEWVRMVGGV